MTKRLGLATLAFAALAASVSQAQLSIHLADEISLDRVGVYRLDDQSSFTRGCFPPCLCPIMLTPDFGGVFTLRPVPSISPSPGDRTFRVGGIRWFVTLGDERVTIRGRGTYRIRAAFGGLTHQLDLHLLIGDEPLAHFDSGVVAGGGDFPRIDITTSENGLFCFDTVIRVSANPITRVCGGIQGIPCRSDREFCKLPNGTCDSADLFGECTPRPNACPDVWDPVCGCDGETYGNECEANAAGVSIDHRGTCGERCGGIAGIPCPEGEFCRTNVGECCCDFFGECTTIPEGCPRVWDPVCGCDGNTYGNACEAAAASVSIDHRGECEIRCGGFPGLPCPTGEFCKTNPGECCCDFFGVCTAPPMACPDVWDPVCGCDGNTYGNECEADAVGVSIDHYGPCERVCGGRLPWPCEVGEFCKKPPGLCDVMDLPGVCTPIPQGCLLPVWDPVCGCDGVTYGNQCEADAASAQIDHRGECEVRCGGIAGLPCPTGEFCKTGPGECCCDFFGVCTAPPIACPEFYDPVCGCDGVTYDNRCFADAASVSVDHDGACGSPGGCTSNMDCVTLGPVFPPEFCRKLPGDCNGTGECVSRPLLCPDIFMPVCGCDGATYANACYAATAGVNVASEGACN